MDREKILRLGRDPRAVEALRSIGGFLWFYTELYPYRTIYTLTVCRGSLCVYIAGEDMMDMKVPLEAYVQFEDHAERLRQLERSLEMLVEFSDELNVESPREAAQQRLG
ncbi:MAG: hypothetical protein QXP98_05300 [Thermoproteus sp.]